MTDAREEKHCFFCAHLILDGLSSWCELRKQGTVCEDFELNKTRWQRVKEKENAV